MYKNSSSTPNNSQYTPVILIVIGFLVLAYNLGVITPQLFKLIFSWPMFFVLLGCYALLKRNLLSGVVMIAAGSIFMLPKIFALGAHWLSEWWPILVVVAGVGILINRRKQKRYEGGVDSPNFETLYSSIDGFIDSDISFSTATHRVSDPIFKGAKIKNNFGETVIDLRKTALESEVTYIDIDCNFGSVKIHLPLGWKIESRCRHFFGTTNDKRYFVRTEADEGRKVVIEGSISFGSVEILG